MTEQTDIDNWDGFCGSNFLRAEQVKSGEDFYVVIEVGVFTDDNGNAKPRLTLEKGDETWDFDLNVTNSNFCKNSGIKSPKELLGKKIFFKKIYVRSPKTNKEVESLRISRIE